MPWSRQAASSRRPSARSTCAATTACTSRARVGSSSGSSWPRSWRPWARPMPPRRRVANGRGLCHHRLRRRTRASPASSPACHEGRRHRHGRTVGADLPRRPGLLHIFRNEARREAGLRAFFRTQMRADYLPFGGCYTTEGYSGSAIWAPAGKPMQTGSAGSSACCPCCPTWPPTWGARCVFEAHGVQASPSAALVPGHPGHRGGAAGQGCGLALLRPVLEHCDAEGTPCYLESSKERNVPFYRRHGFEVVEEVPLPDDGPTLWTMWREPRRRPEGRPPRLFSIDSFRWAGPVRWGGCPPAWRGRR